MSRIDGMRLLAVFLLVALLSGTAGADVLSGDQLKQEEVNYRTETVQTGTFEKTVSTSASEYYPLTKQVRYKYSNAKFIEYTVSRGEEVREGDVLARFRITGSVAEMERMELELKRAEEETERGLKDRDEQILRARAAVSEAADSYERERCSLALRRLEIEREQYADRRQYSLDNQRQAVEEARAAWEMDELVAPMDGVITDLTYKRPDDAVYAGEVLVTMYSTDVMLLHVDNAAGSFRYNMPVTITVGTNKARVDLTGRVVAADNALSDNHRTGHAFIQLDPYDESVKLRNPKATGALIRVEDVLTISRKAATLESGKYFVTKLVDGMVQKRYVNNGPSNTSTIWVLQGVSDGETLILD